MNRGIASFNGVDFELNRIELNRAARALSLSLYIHLCVPVCLSFFLLSTDALPTSSLRETPARERERPQRRDVISYIASAFCLLDGFCLAPQAASARERGLQRYIRRKSNQSLDELLPSLLLSRIQLETLVAGALAAENYEVAREALRSGYLARFRFGITLGFGFDFGSHTRTTYSSMTEFVNVDVCVCLNS